MSFIFTNNANREDAPGALRGMVEQEGFSLLAVTLEKLPAALWDSNQHRSLQSLYNLHRTISKQRKKMS